MVASAAGERTGEEHFRFPRETRITAAAQIRALFRRGKRRRTRHLDVYVSPSPAAFPRLGLVVPRHRQKVVKRNRLKRRLRELGRTLLLPGLRTCGRPVDVLLRARPEAYAATFEQLREQVQHVMEELCSPRS